jgi:F-type H+-transporting ATPase subunit a
MPEQLWVTEILNRLFASPVTSLLRAIHIEPKYPTAPIPNSFSMEVLVFSFLLVLFLLVRSRLSVDRPGGLQHSFEIVEGFIQGQSDEIIGHPSEGYTLKHFAGPMPALALLMVPIELISHLARVLSLTIRLFANMFAGDMVTLVFFSLVPIGVPIVFMGLHIGVSLLQTYIFVLLTTVYLQGAVSEEH